jgi:hypothetical protein
MLKGVLMNKNAVTITIVVCAVIVVAAAAAIGLKLHNSGAASPISTSTVTVTAPPSSNSGGSVPVSTPPVQTPTVTPAGAAPLTDFTVCITPTVGCNGEMRTQPPEIIVSGDGSAFINDLSWTGWGSSGATGSGTMRLNNCEPNCAEGKLSPYQATVTLSDLTSYGSGKQAYADMTVSAPSSSFGTQSYHGLLP